MISSDINKDLFLFYGVYDTKQLLINDLELIPCIFENKNPWKYEFQIYKAIYNLVTKSQENKENIIGLFSPSITERTGLDFHSISKLIKENDADIYVFSPYQYNSLIFYNYWDQAEICHAGIINEVKKLYSLNNAFPTIDFNARTSKFHFSYCNFWAAKKDFFIKIVKDMIYLDELMIKHEIGLNETFHKSQFVYSFNKSLKKTYKLFPFIIERYLSSRLMDIENKIRPKVFYWNDKRSLIDQLEKIKGQKPSIDGPVSRGLHHKSIKTNFKNKKEFYEKIWFKDDIENLDKTNPGTGKRFKSLFNLT